MVELTDSVRIHVLCAVIDNVLDTTHTLAYNAVLNTVLDLVGDSVIDPVDSGSAFQYTEYEMKRLVFRYSRDSVYEC